MTARVHDKARAHPLVWVAAAQTSPARPDQIGVLRQTATIATGVRNRGGSQRIFTGSVYGTATSRAPLGHLSSRSRSRMQKPSRAHSSSSTTFMHSSTDAPLPYGG